MKQILIILIAGFFMSCGGSDSSSSNKWDIDVTTLSANDNVGDWAIIHELSDPDRLNPITSSGASAGYIEGKMFESLVGMDKSTLLYTDPKLATSVAKVSDNHLEYIYNIRKDAYFSDGVPINANNFIFYLKCLKNPFIDCASLRNYFKDVKKAELINGDPYSLKITCSNPYFKMETMLNGLTAYPIHHYDPEGIMENITFEELDNMLSTMANSDSESFEDLPAYKFAQRFNGKEMSRNPLGSGPYIFKEWTTDDKIVLERNPNYWGYKAGELEDNGYVNKFIHKVVKDYDAAVIGMKAGELDVLGLPMEKFMNQTNSKKITDNYTKDLYFIPGYGYIGWNQKKSLFKNKMVRRAMTHLLDRKQIIETLFYNNAQVCKSPIYFQRPEFNDKLVPWAYDPQRAKEILFEQGWEDTDGDGILDKTIDGKKEQFKFTILTNSGNETRKQIGLILAENCRKVGIHVDVQTLEWSIFLDQVSAQKFDAMILGWAMSTTEPDPYQIWHSSQSKDEGSNSISFINKRADELIEMNRREYDPQKRIELMMEFQEILHDEQPYTFIYVSKSNRLMHKRFQNAKVYPFRPGYDPFEWWVPSKFHKYLAGN